MTDIDSMIEKSKIITLAHQPFFGAGSSKLQWLVDDSIDTACTNGRYIKFNTEFFTNLTQEERVGLIVHEVMHVYSKHHIRRGKRDPQLWNVAADYFINILIQDAIEAECARVIEVNGKRVVKGRSCMALPKGGLLDARFRGMSTEQIYKLLEDEGADIPPDAPWGEVEDGEGDPVQEEREIEVMVEQAHNLAKSRGKHFGSAESLIGEYKKPSVDWREVLRKLMQSLTPVDYTYLRSMRNKTHLLLEHDCYIPDYHRENCGEIVIGIDTSGSVSDGEIQQFMGEIQSICEEVQPSRVHVVQCDTVVQHTDTFEMGQPFKVTRLAGRGGTEFQPVFDWVDEQGITPMALVYLTDGYCQAPRQPEYPVYWGVTTDNQGHLFGDVMSVNFSQ